MKKNLIATFLLAFISVSGMSAAQLTPSDSVLKFTYVPSQGGFVSGSSLKLLFKLEFDKGWHGQSHTPSMEGLIPTVLTLEGSEGITFGRVAYPKGEMVKFEFSEEPLSTYAGTVYIGATAALSPDMAEGEYSIMATLTVQSCDDKSCLPPSDIPVTVPVEVLALAENVKPLNADIYANNKKLFEQGAESSGASSSGEIKEYFTSNGLLLTYLFIFLGGLALNLTPCVYPLIPVTVSYFGGKSEKGQGQLIAHAIFYLLGMSAMYSALGVFAALTGGMFGELLQNPIVTIFIVAVMLGLALAMFGVWEITVPSGLQQIGGKNREGYFGTFLMGLTVGIIAAPCIGPFVLGLLAFVGEMGDPFMGFTMFFALSMGLGLPFVFLAIFSGSLSSLPRSGMWMVWVKQAFGVILLAMAVYFMEPLLPKSFYHILFGLVLVFGGLFLGFLSRASTAGAGFKFVRWAVSLSFIAIGAFIAYPQNVNDGPRIEWADATEQAIDASRKPVIIDFSAAWCLPCKELEHFTFTDERVVEISDKFDTFFADVTTSGNPEMEKLKKKYGVVGVPTVLFLDSDGKEMKDLRVVGFVSADEFLSRMKKALE